MSPRRARPYDRPAPDDWVPYDHPPPIPVEGGLRARSRRGDIGETWWSQRFVAALERAYGTTASRLARGRAYARAGQVLGLDLRRRASSRPPSRGRDRSRMRCRSASRS